MSSLKQNLAILRKAGLQIPETADKYAKDQDYRLREIASVWTCNCGNVYESLIPIKGYNHSCGKVSKETWSKSGGFS